jgi:hypothetical protein
MLLIVKVEREISTIYGENAKKRHDFIGDF